MCENIWWGKRDKNALRLARRYLYLQKKKSVEKRAGECKYCRKCRGYVNTEPTNKNNQNQIKNAPALGIVRIWLERWNNLRGCTGFT